MILECNEVYYTYSDGTAALQGIDMNIPRGQFDILLGPNGSGKTTLFKIVTGLLKPVTGQVNVDNRVFSEYTKEELYRRIGFVFQDPNDQLFAPTVGDDVSFGPSNLGLSHNEIRQRVEGALEMVGIAHLAKKPVHCLSYGQKKRAAIAGVLAMKPEIIILDEPIAGLDPVGVREIMKLLVRLNKEEGITILMATHDVDLVPLYADTVFVLKAGKIILSGTPREVFSAKETIRSAGLRLPRVAHLGEILAKKDGLFLNEIPLTIGEARQMVLSVARGEGDKGD
jgi:cobalt/nickel transport system ATP-binding protein